MKSAAILGIRVDTNSLNDVLKTVRHYIASGQPHQIATINTEFVMEARRNSQFKKVLNEANLSIADGAGILLAAKLLNQPIPPRITGVDLVPQLCKLAAEHQYRVFLLGGRDGVGEEVAKILTDRFPGLQIVGTYEGSPTDKQVLSQLKATKPDILFVAWGAPKQDIWINQNKQAVNIPVMMGVGGTYDFIAGKQKRAPQWMRALWLEWLWRLLREPSRWKRQLALPHMFLIILWQKLLGRA